MPIALYVIVSNPRKYPLRRRDLRNLKTVSKKKSEFKENSKMKNEVTAMKMKLNVKYFEKNSKRKTVITAIKKKLKVKSLPTALVSKPPRPYIRTICGESAFRLIRRDGQAGWRK